MAVLLASHMIAVYSTFIYSLTNVPHASMHVGVVATCTYVPMLAMAWLDRRRRCARHDSSKKALFLLGVASVAIALPVLVLYTVGYGPESEDIRLEYAENEWMSVLESGEEKPLIPGFDEELKAFDDPAEWYWFLTAEYEDNAESCNAGIITGDMHTYLFRSEYVKYLASYNADGNEEGRGYLSEAVAEFEACMAAQ